MTLVLEKPVYLPPLYTLPSGMEIISHSLPSPLPFKKGTAGEKGHEDFCSTP